MYGICTAAVIYFGVQDVAAGRVTAGELAALILYMGLIREPTQRSGFLVSVFTNAAGAGKRIFGVLDAKSPVIERPKASPLPRVRGDVKFDNVSAGYGPGGEAVHGLSFDARPGQLVALLGAPGSGKSTIAHLLPRFYDVSAGRITIDGNDVRDVSRESLRKNVGIVLQDSFAFSATIRDNIAYGRDDATTDEIVRAAKVAQLHEFIMSLPDGFDTWVGERGITLSGGQRQRLAIARTVLLDPPIIILDDSTSSVDVSTELQIQKALAEVVKGRTTFVITHRLSTIRNADLILVLGKGEIVERGTRSELLSRNGYYKRIHDLQISSQDVDTLFEKDEPTFELQPAKDPTGEAEEGPASSHETALDDEMKYPAYSVRQVMARLLGYSRPYSHLFMVVIVCMIAWIGVGAAWPWIIKLAIDGYAVGGDGDQSGLNLIVVILLLAALVHSVSGYFLETVWAFLGQRVLYALRMSMVNHLQRLSIAFYDRSQVGRVMSRLQNDVRELSVFWYMIASTTPNVLTSGIIVVVMFAINVHRVRRATRSHNHGLGCVAASPRCNILAAIRRLRQ